MAGPGKKIDVYISYWKMGDFPASYASLPAVPLSDAFSDPTQEEIAQGGTHVTPRHLVERRMFVAISRRKTVVKCFRNSRFMRFFLQYAEGFFS